jgi:hypothetical protein
MAEFDPPLEFSLTPVSDTMFVGRESDAGRWMPVTFADGYVHFGVRGYPRTS